MDVRVLSPRDATPKFQYAGRDSETEVRFRPIDLECHISVEIVSRGVGTHRCRRRRYQPSDADSSVISDKNHRVGVENDASGLVDLGLPLVISLGTLRRIRYRPTLSRYCH
ncbi:hypothetical protein J6590_100404 [Homalodisca vitripennis]|nr:hypothetical protein J6590_100404 [Homalodisca vitripennis]